MASYFVRENRQSSYVELNRQEIKERLSNGIIRGDFIVTEDDGIKNPYKIMNDHTVVWITVDELLSSPDDTDRNIDYNSEDIPGEGAISVLRFFAWFDLVFGIIASIIIWNNTDNYSRGIGTFIGFGVLLQGIFICAFFLVIASMAENLFAIRRNTDSK